MYIPPKPKYSPEKLYKSDINDLVEDTMQKGGFGSGVRGHKTANSDAAIKRIEDLLEKAKLAKSPQARAKLMTSAREIFHHGISSQDQKRLKAKLSAEKVSDLKLL